MGDPTDGHTEDSAQTIPETRLIREAIDGERLLIVVGAGVSRSATAARDRSAEAPKESYWQGLLELGLETIADGRAKGILSDLLAQGDSKSAIHVAEAIEDAFGGRSDFAFYCWLRETVGRLRPTNRDVLEAIRDLHVPVATTNYDRLLEEVMGRRPITFEDAEESLSFVRNENVNNAILHIHGYYEQPQSVIFGARSYYELLDRKGYAEAILRALAIRYTWLFVGCGQGLQDPHFEDFILWMERTLGNRIPWHYQLLAQEDAPATRITGRGRIRPIYYGKTHEDLGPFLRSLIRSTRIRAPSNQSGDIISSLHFCTGRDSELRAFRKALLQDYPKPIAILGGYGLGKTTFCYAGFYSPDVITRYRKRHYVRLNAATSTGAMLQAIARSLDLQAPAALAGSFSDRSSQDLLDRIVDKIKETRTLLVLDGVETPWHANESGTETDLAKLYEGAAVSNSAIVAVLTGYRRPLKVPWDLRIDLTPLSDEDGSCLFIEVAKDVAKEMEKNVSTLSNSDALRSLIKTLDGIPLAIKLMAHTAVIKVGDEGGSREDWESVLTTLRNEWQEKRDPDLRQQRLACLIRPLFSLLVSLRVALAELEKKDELATQCLALMGLLPEGILETDSHKLSAIDGHVDALKRRGFVFVADGRLRLEPSIRELVQEELASRIDRSNDNDWRAIADYYLYKAKTGEAIGWGQVKDADTDINDRIESLKADANNIETVIRYELELKVGDRCHRAIRNALALGRFYRFSGAGNRHIVEDAREACRTLEGYYSIELKADCSRVLGSIQLVRVGESDLHAQACYNDADADYKNLPDKVRMSLGHAHCERGRGDIAKYKGGDSSTQKTAVEWYEKARDGYVNLLDSLSEEECDTTANDNTDGSRWQAKRGKAWCLANIGDLTHMLREDDTRENDKVIEEARRLYKDARDIFQDIGDAIGDAYCQKGLGDISCIKPFPDKKAIEYYEEARKLYCRGGYKVGIADCEYSLADEALRSGDGDGAEKHYEKARNLYYQIGSLHGVANCVYSLGDVRLLCSLKGEANERQANERQAKKHYHDALKRYEEVDSRLGPANCHQGLGDLLSGQQRVDEYNETAEMLRQAFGHTVDPSFTLGSASGTTGRPAPDWKRWRR